MQYITGSVKLQTIYNRRDCNIYTAAYAIQYLRYAIRINTLYCIYIYSIYITRIYIYIYVRIQGRSDTGGALVNNNASIVCYKEEKYESE